MDVRDKTEKERFNEYREEERRRGGFAYQLLNRLVHLGYTVLYRIRR